jgi:hypothetical protein
VSLKSPSQKEWGEMITKPGHSFPFVKFADGTEVEITAVSAAAFEGASQKASSGKSAVVWKGCIDDDTLRVVRKRDHNLLMALYRHAGKTKYMICMMAVKSFGPEDQVVGHPNFPSRSVCHHL